MSADPFIATFAVIAFVGTAWNVRRVAHLNSIRDVHDRFKDAGRRNEVRGWNRDCPLCASYCGQLVPRFEVPPFVQKLPCASALPCPNHASLVVRGRSQSAYLAMIDERRAALTVQNEAYRSGPGRMDSWDA